MNILLQFPTLSRPEKFKHCLIKYLLMSSKKHRLFFNINCDYDDKSMNNHMVIKSIKYIFDSYDHIDYKINFDHNTTKIDAINSHIDGIDFDIVICLSDDMLPKQYNWDDIIATKMQESFPDTDGALHFNDGNQENKLITLSILGRKLYEEFGYIYHPDYKSLYCDNEFTNEVYRMNKVAYFKDIIISHEHYSVEGTINHGDYDLAAHKTLQYSGRDSQVYIKRAELGFPRERITND